MNQPTTEIENFENSYLFPLFMEDGLNYVNYYTPTLINQGGCGVFAHLLGQELAKLNIPFKYIGLSLESKTSQKDLEDFLADIDHKKMNISHIVVEVKDTFYCDANGIVNTDYYTAYGIVEIPSETLEKLLKRKDTWNTVFDTDTIPSIEKYLEFMFDHILEYHKGFFDFSGVKEIELTKKTIKHKEKTSIFNVLSQLI